ncbi:MAG TPA: non-ribosomal peptide synthase/polyketide synthase, partial [Thermoanaerobaculia bacterium]|nr:non-ribosomal peptide synthase/polyketide synthase [Thermoanaerobaculia bacterium]
MSELAQRISQLSPERLKALLHRLRPETGGGDAEPIAQQNRECPRFPLSFAQERLWLLDRLEPGLASYNIAAAVELAGPLDRGALAASLGEVVGRHESLRTTFGLAGEQPVQVVHTAAPADLPLPLPLVDLRGLDAAERDARAATLALQEARRPFELDRGPLLRGCLLWLGEELHCLLLVLHHIVADGWSARVLIGEIGELYAARIAARPAALPALAIQYADFAVWQRGRLEGEALAGELAYWRAQLSELPVLTLPADRARPAAAPAEGDRRRLSISPPLAAAVRRFAEREQATPFMVLLAVFCRWLARSCGEDDVVLATPAAGRNRSELEGLIGFFANTLVLRVDLAGDPSLRQLLARVRETVAGAFAHQELPFARLVQELAPERSLGATPLAQVMLSLEEEALAPRLPGLAVSVREIDNKTSKLDLLLALRPGTDGELDGYLEYSVALFDATTVERLGRQFTRLLASAVAQPEARLSQWPALSDAESHQLLAEWNDSATGRDALGSIVEAVEAQVGRTPLAPAVCDDARVWTYRELNANANRLARHLRACGVGNESLVAVCLDRSLDLLAVLLGILKAGGAYVPLDPAYPSARLELMLEDSRASLLVTSEALLARLPTPQVPTLCLDREAPAILARPPEDLEEKPEPGALAYVIYTSGSTGRPKGVGIEHRSAAALLEWARQAFTPGELAGVLAATSICFDLSVFELFVPLACGGRVILAADALALPGLAMASQVTLINTVPSALSELLRLGAVPPGVETINLAGEVLPQPLVELIYAQTPVRRVLNLYGPSEDTTYSTIGRPARGESSPPAIGRPLGDTRVHVLDAALELLPAGVAGELCIAGRGLARGYLGRPDLTAEKFVPDPFADEPGARMYRTGDRARRRRDGELELFGRLDHQIKVRGFRIEPGEIEAALLAYGALRAVAVQPYEAAPGDRRLAAYLVAADGRTVPPAGELRSWLAGRLPDFMLPAAFVTLTALPLTPSGKLDRKALPEPRPEAGPAGGAALPLTPVEEVLAAIWEDLLDSPQVNGGDHFFALGGHSLLATQVVSRVRRAFAVDLPLRALFETPTLAALAARIEAARQSGGGIGLPPLTPRGAEWESRGLPLSFAQQRLWFLAELEPDNPAYHLAQVVEAGGRLDLPVLAWSLGEVVRRHEALRTRFEARGGEPAQVIEGATVLAVPVIDLSGLDAGRRGELAASLAAAEASRPFDLRQAPLLRACLLRLAAGEQRVVLTLHHIVGDGWSMGVLVSEVAALYAAGLAGQPSPLSAPPIQYADYALWQRSWLAGELLAGQIAYWRRQLAGAPARLELPTDRPRPPVQRFRGGTRLFAQAPAAGESLRALCRAEGVTFFMALLALFQLLLARYSGQEDVSVGTPVAGRHHVELEGLIGFFVNTLVLRANLAGEPSFAALLARVRDASLDAFAHQDLPFERLVEELQPQRSLAYSPLFQVMFALQNTPASALALGDLVLAASDPDLAAAKFELSLSLRDTPGGLTGCLTYNCDLFHAATAQRLLDHLAALLGAAPLQPARRVWELPMLGVTECAQLLCEANDTAAAWPGDATVHQLFERQARRAPGAPALVCEDEVVTYGELDRRAGRLARRLRRAGAGTESLVAVCTDRSAAMVVALLGVLKAGAAYLPLDPALPDERLAFLVADSGVRLLVTQASLSGRMPALSPGGSGGGVRAIVLDEPGEVAAGEELRPVVLGASLAYVIYTSGSTGQPKGVAVENRQLSHYVRAVSERLDLGADASFATVSTLAADLGHTAIFPALVSGACLHVIAAARAADAEELAAYCERHPIDCLKIVPSHLAALLTASRPQRLLPRRHLILGGEAASWRQVEALRAFAGECRIFNHYGPTETTVGVLTFAVPASGGPVAGGSLPLGRPLPDTAVYLLDRHLEPVPSGVAGELYIGGAGLARGYLARPDLTAERFIPSPWGGSPGARLYRSGDLARRLPDGNLEFLGRVDRQAKIRGFRVEPAEVAAVLRRHPAVRDAVVLVRADGAGERRLVAYVVTSAALDLDELRGFAAGKLPDYMLPSAFVAVAAIPVTANGKMDERALPDPEWTAAAAYVAPRTPLEELLAGIWAEVLGGGRPVGGEDDFFALGGHSLLATQLVSRIRQALELELPLRRLFETPTVAGLAATLAAARRQPGRPPSPPLRRTSPSPPPLSYAQERLWFLDQMAPGDVAYNLPYFARVEGPLAVAALAAALGEVRRRHAALRASFPELDGRPLQVIAPPHPLALPVIDLRGLPGEGARRHEAARLTAAEAARPFDLASGPLLRCTMLRLEEEEHTVLLAMHHAVSDAWSRGVLVREVAALYSPAVAGLASPLPELPLQYADFAAWQREWLRGEALEAELAYWRERLGGGVPPLHLPADRPRPVLLSSRGRCRAFALPAQLRCAVHSAARAAGATPFMILLAGFAALLHRYTQQTDLVVGSPVANRNRAEIEGLIGFFVNTLALRADLSGEPGFHSVVARLRATALEAYEHQDVPFEKVVEAVAGERRLDRTPLFSVAFILQNAPLPKLELGATRWCPVEVHNGTAKFDLTLALSDAGEGMEGALEYAADLFDAATIERLAGHLLTLLAGAVAAPATPLGTLPLLTAGEVEQIAVWNATGRAAAPSECIHHLFEAQVARTPQAEALVCGEQRLSYAELDRRANRLAQTLQAQGVGPEERVGVLLERSPELVVALLAILKAGGAYVPLDSAYPAERLRFMVADAGVRVLVAGERELGRLPGLAGRAGPAIVRPHAGGEALGAGSSTGPASGSGPHHLAYVIYTSGSTGRPKGVAVEHRSAAMLLHWAREVFSDSELSGVLAATSICFDLSVFELFAPLAWGGRVVLVSDALELPALSAAAGVTLVNTVPSVMAELLRLQGLPASVRTINLAGEPLPRPLATSLYGLGTVERVLNLYGPSEDTTYSTFAVVARDDTRPPAIGRPIAGTRAYLLDPRLEPVPAGVPGELFLGGAGLARGYLGRPELTAARFVPDPFAGEPGARLYGTGDFVRRRADGELEFLGRLDHQVKVRGFRIELGEVEAALAAYPRVREAVAMVSPAAPGAPGAAGDRRLVAYLVPAEPGAAIAPQELREFLAARLPAPMLPSAFIALAALPRMPNGKVDRGALPAPLAGGTPGALAAGPYRPPRTLTEGAVAEIWEEVLGVGRAGVDDNFFALGGHSLLAAQVVSRLRRTLTVDLPLRTLFEWPTVAALAAWIDAARPGAPTPAPPIPRVARDVSLPLSFAQQRFWFLAQLEPDNPAYNIGQPVLLEGLLDIPALARGFAEVVRRHEVLRTFFAVVDGSPSQLVAAAAPLPVPVVDLSGLPAARRGALARQLTVHEVRRRFDLARGPLLRVHLLRLGEREHVALVVLHHIAGDGWSIGVLVRELVHFYRAFSGSEAAPLPELPVQYADYAVWQRGLLTGEALAREVAHWRVVLADAPAALDLPTDRPRPVLAGWSGARQPFALPAALVTALRQAGREAGTTLFMTLLAGFQALLARYAGAEDLCVGSPVAGRHHLETEGLIGCFVNTLTLRTSLADAPSFSELLHRVREMTLTAFSHQDLPFERLVEELQPERSLTHTPLFQVLFALHNTPGLKLALPGLELRLLEEERAAAKFDLSLSVVEQDGALAGSVEYRHDLFDPPRIARLREHLHTLLAAAAADPARPAGELPLLGEAERWQLLGEWNAAGEMMPESSLTLPELLQAQASRTPRATALVVGEERIEYAELDQRANRLARHLRRLGVVPEATVGIFCERSVAMVVALLGALKAGAAYVPLDPSYPSERLQFMAEDAKLAAILTEESLIARLPPGVARCGARIVRLDGDRPAIECESAAALAAVAGPRHLAYVIYTSGSTGRPKGVAIEHRSVVALLDWARRTFASEELAGVLAATSICFDLSVFELFVPLAAGGMVILAENVLALPTLPAAAEVTLLNTVPSAAAELLTLAGLPLAIRTVCLAGEPLPSSLAGLLHAGGRGLRLYNLYGPSEDTTYSTAARIAPDDGAAPGIGRPIPGSRAYVLDAHWQPVAGGVPGELYLGGAGLARGYLGQPWLTAERFVPDPFSGEPGARLYRTGDLVRQRSGGDLDFLGRLDHQVKVRGFRIELGEIEAALGRHPRVREAVVMAREDGGPGALRLVAYVATGEGEVPAAAELRALLAQSLPEHMLPAAYVGLAALPRTPNGKVDRRALPASAARPAGGVAYVAPRSPFEELLAGIWADVLGIEPPGAEDDFFALGGHSLLTARVAARLREACGVELPLRLLFEARTLAVLAAAVDQALRKGVGSPPLLRGPAGSGDSPLSFAQERLWFLDRLAPGRATYNVPIAVRLAGAALNGAALAASLGEVVARHEVLRTTFGEAGGLPFQRVAPPAPVLLPRVDLSALPSGRREGEGRRLLAAAAELPFDLGRGPLLRVLLVRIAAGEHFFLITLHHIVADGWSAGVLVRELAALYPATAAQPSPLPALPVQYADFARWQRSWLRGEALEERLGAVRGRLAGAPMVLELPADRPRPAIPSGRGGVRPLRLPEVLVRSLSALGRRAGGTLFMTLLAAWKAALHRASGQDDVVVGSPAAGRDRAELEGLIGFFVNTLVLRTAVAADIPFAALLGRVRDGALAAYAWQDLPFDRVVEELAPERSLAYSPLVQVTFALQNAPFAEIELPGLTFSPLPLAGSTAKFDLTLALAPRGEELVGALEFNRDLFDATTAERFLGSFAVLLAAAAADPGLPLAALPFCTAVEEHQVLREWNDTALPVEVSHSVHSLVFAIAASRPEALAVAAGGEDLSYGELSSRASLLAARLRGLGVGPEVVVALCLERSPELVIAALGVLAAGGAYLPLDPASPPERLAALLADAGAPVLISDAGLAGQLGDRVAALAGVELLTLDGVGGPPALQGGSVLSAAPRSAAGNLAYVIYTSGSTGRPKGVAVEHASLLRLIAWHRDAYAMRPDDRVTLLASPAFDASVWEIWPCLTAGASLWIPFAAVRTDPARLSAWWKEHGITLSFLPTPLAEAVLAEPLPAGLALRSLLTGGDRLNRRPAAGLPFRLVNHYGPTEATVVATSGAVTEEGCGHPSIGRPISNTTVYLLDPALSLAPIGVPGEVCLGGNVARGYLHRPDLTAESFVPDAWSGVAGARLYRTGDLARLLPDGRLDFLGRRDHQVKVRGVRIELGEIESALVSLSGVAAATVAVRGEGAGRRLVAYVVPVGEPDIADWRAALRERLPEAMVPSSWTLLTALPLTANGKVDRRALPEPQGDVAAAEGAAAPQTPTEELLAGLFAAVLGVQAVGRDASFFDLGGHSLLVTKLVSQVRAAFAVELPLRALFTSPTVRELAEVIKETRRRDRMPAPPSLEPVQRDGTLPLSFAQERLWLLDQLEPASPAYTIPMRLRLTGDLDVAVLAAAVGEIVRRHEALRTVFPAQAGRPVQSIRPASAFGWSVVDLSGHPGAEHRQVAEAVRRGFDLASGPLLRLTLYRLGTREHVLLVTLHHIVGDGWSTGVFVRELSALYAAFSQGRPSPLAELPVQYADFAVWQRSWLTGELLQSQLGYWRERLAGAPAMLELPLDRPRPALQTSAGGLRGLTLSTDLVDGLRALSRRRGATLFMTLLAAGQLLLARLAGQEDILVGSPIAGRNRAEVEGLIGCFLNTLVLRTDLSGSPSFDELLDRVRESTLDAYAHQDLPFERLLEELRPERDLSRTPLFQVFFNMLSFPEVALRLPGLQLWPESVSSPLAKFDMTFYLKETEGGLQVDLVYNSDLFDAVRAEELLAQYELVLRAVAAEPERAIGGISLVTAGATARLPDPTAALSARWEGAVHDLFSGHARRSPGSLAAVDPAETWTYGELEAQANRLAGWLGAGGLTAGDVVALWAHRSAPLVWGVLGVLKAGAVFIMLDPRYPAPRQAQMLRLARPRAWLQVEAAGPVPEELGRELDDLGCSCRLRLPARADDRGALDDFPPEPPGVTVGPDAAAYVAFTSGSTGVPKGVRGRHGSLSHFIPWLRQRFHLGADDRFSMLSGLAHDPLHRDLFTPLQLGAAVVIPDPARMDEPGWLAAWMRREGVTIAHLTPALGQILTAGNETEAGTEVPSLRHVFLVGDVLTRRDVARLRRLAPRVTVVNYYGSTETQRAVGYHVAEGPDRERVKEVLPLGRGTPDVQLLVLNAAGALAGVGELGELSVRSPHLALGYLGDPQLTAERFAVNPFTGSPDDRLYRTGDLGRYLPNGEAVFAGRADTQVKVRGFRIELGEIEAVLLGFPGVREAVVVARQDGGDERYLAAYVVPAGGAALAAPELRAFLRERLPDYMVPAAFMLLERLPLTPNRKVDRRALPAPDRNSRESAFVAPDGAVEELLADLWSELLGVARIGANDHFFDLGGHSLLASRLLSRIRALLGVELSLRRIFELPTLRGLAREIALLRNAGATVAPPLDAVPRGVPLPLSFAQERLWFLDQLDPGSAAYNLATAVRLAGRFEMPAFAAALAAIVGRHEVLRTTYSPTGTGGAVQRIASPAPFTLPVIDLAALPAASRETTTLALARAEAGRPFVLASGPVLRVVLLRLAAEEHVALLAFHHIAVDGWSLEIFMRELSMLYGAALDCRPSPLPPLPIQYADFAIWQRAWLTGRVLAEQVEHWRRTLAGLRELLDLPTDRPRPAIQSARGGQRSTALPQSLALALQDLGRRHGATLFMVLAAGWTALLHRWTGSEDIAVGTPVANRSRPEVESLIGFFANTLVLRIDLAEDPTFAELAARVREVCLAALDHQDVSFEKLVEELAPRRSLGHAPLFQVLFALQNTPLATTESGELRLSPVAVGSGAAKFDLSLSLVPGTLGLSGKLEYSRDLFDAATVERLLAHFHCLLAAALRRPEARLSDLPLLSAAERHQLVEWNDTGAGLLPGLRVHDLIARQAARTPDAIAVEDLVGGRLTYRELESGAEGLARRLARFGVGPEVLVGVAVERSVEMLVSLLAVLKAGGGYVPLDPEFPAERLAYMVADSGLRVLLTEERLLARFAPEPGVTLVV